jgi:hypothetical protein
MKTGWLVAALVGSIVVAAPAPCAAQEPVTLLAQFDGELKPGDTVWVTDAQGREIKGEIGALEPGAITLRGRSGRTFNLSDVRQVAVRRHDSVANGGIVGMTVGALAGLGIGIAGCATYPKDDPLRGDACLMAIGLSWIPGLAVGGLVGVGIDAMIPGNKLVVYRGAGPGGASHARLSVAPVITPRTRGVAMAFSF